MTILAELVIGKDVDDWPSIIPKIKQTELWGFELLVSSLWRWMVDPITTEEQIPRVFTKVHFNKDLTGGEIARLMLADHGIRDVQLISNTGWLTDHYNPAKQNR